MRIFSIFSHVCVCAISIRVYCVPPPLMALHPPLLLGLYPTLLAIKRHGRTFIHAQYINDQMVQGKNSRKSSNRGHFWMVKNLDCDHSSGCSANESAPSPLKGNGIEYVPEKELKLMYRDHEIEITHWGEQLFIIISRVSSRNFGLGWEWAWQLHTPLYRTSFTINFNLNSVERKRRKVCMFLVIWYTWIL